MTDEPFDKRTHRDRLKALLHADSEPKLSAELDPETEGTEAKNHAFGYLRGLHAASSALEIRFRDGNSMFFPYALLGVWQYNPSEGILLKFSGDLMYVVLIRGSNLDKPLSDGGINLTTAGLQRNRVLWIREMAKHEIERVGETGPTIDSIEVGEFATHEERREWLKEKATVFLRNSE